MVAGLVLRVLQISKCSHRVLVRQIIPRINDHAAIVAEAYSRMENGQLSSVLTTSWLMIKVTGLKTPALDTTIVTTALIKISSDLDSLEQAAWLITAYLLTYNCRSPLLLKATTN